MAVSYNPFTDSGRRNLKLYFFKNKPQVMIVTIMLIVVLFGLSTLLWFGRNDDDTQNQYPQQQIINKKEDLPIIPIVLSTLDQPLIIEPN